MPQPTSATRTQPIVDLGFDSSSASASWRELRAWTSGRAPSPQSGPAHGSRTGGGALPSRHHHIASRQLQPFSIIALGGCLPLPHRPHPPFSRNLGGSADNRLPPQVASFHLHPSTLASLLDPSTDFAETPQTSTRPVLLLFSDSYLISASPLCRLYSGTSPSSAGGSLCLHALSVSS
jgi:hypothetical protein